MIMVMVVLTSRPRCSNDRLLLVHCIVGQGSDPFEEVYILGACRVSKDVQRWGEFVEQAKENGFQVRERPSHSLCITSPVTFLWTVTSSCIITKHSLHALFRFVTGSRSYGGGQHATALGFGCHEADWQGPRNCKVHGDPNGWYAFPDVVHVGLFFFSPSAFLLFRRHWKK